MQDNEDLIRCAEQLGALAAPERLQIVHFLRDGPKNVTQIAKYVGIPAVNVAHHTGVLKLAGIIKSRKDGRFVYYSLIPELVQQESSKATREFLNFGYVRVEVVGDKKTS
jgi:DNA-binding transcriptional ArsR family regulator